MRQGRIAPLKDAFHEFQHSFRFFDLMARAILSAKKQNDLGIFFQPWNRMKN